MIKRSLGRSWNLNLSLLRLHPGVRSGPWPFLGIEIPRLIAKGSANSSQSSRSHGLARRNGSLSGATAEVLGFWSLHFEKNHGGMGCDGVYHSHEVDGIFIRDISHIFQIKILKGRLYVETRVIWLHPNLINSFLLAGRFPKNSLSPRSLTISPTTCLVTDKMGKPLIDIRKKKTWQWKNNYLKIYLRLKWCFSIVMLLFTGLINGCDSTAKSKCFFGSPCFSSLKRNLMIFFDFLILLIKTI